MTRRSRLFPQRIRRSRSKNGKLTDIKLWLKHNSKKMKSILRSTTIIIIIIIILLRVTNEMILLADGSDHFFQFPVAPVVVSFSDGLQNATKYSWGAAGGE